ncbi:hypothetical protein HETIRDRAFT_108581 [Heterobasidion irregulare TC 32-1]|uniref:Uncharacterized protein n=1 Tax=Heterobasidion irregulare (strain TC 32-1) TaxID=747525 RepID=W4JMD2_HETIT|nr:uncharacterized protein HETIRDRAFT_108581 [Heterobasidion irregulare TC 32-1]ETW74688.1 hypothetical protein HETIRDRAFT_108581 [Heterobasidion irregulare TC 32-1]
MLVTSVYARQQNTQSASGHVLVLKHSDKTVLVGVPESYADLELLSRNVFNIARGALVLATDDLDICQGSAVHIHSSAWDHIKYIVETITVGFEDQHIAIGVAVDQNEPIFTHGQSSASKWANAPLNAFQTQPKKESSHSHVSDRMFSRAQQIQQQGAENIDWENAPVDDHSADDGMFEEHYTSSRKGKGRALQQILSDDEEDTAKENIFKDPTANKPSSLRASIHLTSAGTPVSTKKTGPRSSANRTLFPTPRNDVTDVFSPKGKGPASRLSRGSPERDDNSGYEDKAREGSLGSYEVVASPRDTSKTLQFDKEPRSPKAIFAINRSEASSERTATPKWTSQSTDETDGQGPSNAKPKFKPQQSLLKVQSPAMSANKPLVLAQPLSGLDDKILVTIAYPPTGQATFNLDHEGARLFVQETDESDDEMEISMECAKEDTMSKAGARDGRMFIIKMDTE